MPNIREIAKRAGVGIATVSRYINNTGYVSEEVKLKIQKEIDDSGYTPNALARAIFTKNSKTLGLMIPNITNPFFNQMATVIEEHANRYGYTLFLCNTEDNKEKEMEYLDILKSHRVAGIIASRTMCKDEYLNIQIPVVSFENRISPEIPTISSNNYSGGKMAFRHLYDRGCRKILHIKGPKVFDATEMRCKGFVDAAKKEKVEVDVIGFESDFHVKMLDKDLNNIKDIEKYDGIFVFNDIAAAIVMKYLKERDIRIPEDIQIIGFDNSFICELLQPSLTTIQQPIEELGFLVVEFLINLINDEDVIIKNHLLETKLIQRESTLLSS
ncbi:LacI family DNA-binding transcriptional regulator [Tissierella praeacuta]|uniref:LacI family DNA-binding transcriptional regulator n=1 Tax=Tissierella praeacuta TaxID=43131 RepID=UPI0033409F0F